MQCLVKSNPEVKALLKKYTDILGSESAAYYVVSMNNGLPLDLAPDGSVSELYTALVSSGMTEEEAVLAKSVIYTPLYMDKYGDWSLEYDALNGSEEPSITTLLMDPILSDHATIQGILNNPRVVVDQCTALERSNVVNSTPAILSAVRKERQDYVNEAVDNWLATKPTMPDIDALRMRVVAKAESEFDSQTMNKTIIAILQYLAQRFSDDVKPNGPFYTGTTALGQMRANFLNSLANRFEHPGMTTMSLNQQLLISIHLMNSVLNGRDLSTTVPAMVEQYIRMFLDSDFIQDLFLAIKDVHGENIHPERMIKLATDYVSGKLQTTERHLKLLNFWFSLGQFFRGLFKQKTKKENRALERNMLDALAVYFSCANDLARSTDKELNTIFYTCRPKSVHVTAKEVVQNIIKGFLSRIIALLKSQSSAMLGDEAEQLAELQEQITQLEAIENLEKSQQDIARIAAMLEFVVKGLSEAARAYQMIVQMSSGPIEQVNAAQLDNIQHNVIGFYKNLLLQWIVKWAKEDTTGNAAAGTSFHDAMELIQQNINRIESEFDLLNLRYTEYATEQLAKLTVVGDQKRFIYNMHLWLSNKINGGHLSFFDRWLKGGFASDSQVIRLFDFNLRQTNHLTRQVTDAVGRSLHKKYRDAEKEFRKISNPFTNYFKLLYERDEYGDYTGNLRSSVNRGAFDRKLRDKTAELRKTYNVTVDENDGSLHFENDDDWRGYHDELDLYIEQIGGHRRYKAAYYIERRKRLSRTTINIIDNINKEIRELENKCTESVEITNPDGSKSTIKVPLTYKLKKQADRDRLVELKRQREDLSNPYSIVYDASGKITSITPKSGIEALIALEMLSWKLYQKGDAGFKYRNDTSKYFAVRKQLLDLYTKKIGVETNPLTGQKYTQFDVDQLMAKFDWENSTTQISLDYYDYIQRITFGSKFNADRIELNARKNAIMRCCYPKRGYYNPDLDKLNDEAWAELKRIDEAYNGTSGGTNRKLSKDEVEELLKLTTTYPVTKAGTNEIYYNWLKDRYIAAGKYDEFLQKYTYTATVKKYKKLPDGSTHLYTELVIKPLSVFSQQGPASPTYIEQPGGTGIFSELYEAPGAIDEEYDPTDPDAIQVDKDMYYDKEFDELMKNPKIKAFYDECVKALDLAWSKIPSTYRKNKYRLPQRRDDIGSLMTRKHGMKAWWNAVKGEFKVNETDVDYNEEFTRRPDGSFVETIPMRYIRDIENPNMIDTDLISLIADFTEMAQNFENKQAIQPLWELVSFLLRGGFAGRSEGISDQSKRFDTHKSMYMYGRMRQGVNPGMKMGRAQQILSKSMYKIMLLSHSKLMVHNWPAVLKNWWDSGSTLYAEIASGRDFDVSCFKSAVYRIGKDLGNTVCSIPLGRTHTRSETAAQMQANGVSSSIHEMFRGTGKWWIRRVIENHGSMGEYSLVDYLYKGLITQMIYNSVRLIEDPTTGLTVFATKQQAQYYYTRAGYTANEGKKAWRKGIKHTDANGNVSYSRTTLADAFYVDENGGYVLKSEFEDLVRPVIDELTGKRSNKLETLVEGFIRERSSVINGMLDTYDRNGAQTNFIGAAILLMRGWCVAQQVDYNKDGHDFAVYEEDDVDMSKNALAKVYGRAMRSAYDSGAGLVRQEAPDQYAGQYDFLAGGTRQGAWTLVPFLKAYSKLFLDFNMIKFALPDSLLDNLGMESSSLTDLQKYIIARMNCTLMSIAATSMITFLSGKGIEDDPDNWILWLLYAASVAGISERAAQMWFVGLVFTLTDIVKTPAVSTAYIQDIGYTLSALLDMMAIIYDKATGGNGNLEAYETISSGAYKNKQKWMRNVSRASSLIPGISELGFDNLYRRGVFDGSINGLRSTATWYYQVFPTNTLVYRPQVTTEKGQLRKAKEGELKPQRGIYGVMYNEKGTDWKEYFYDPNTSVMDKLKFTMFGYKDNDSGDSKSKSKKSTKKKTILPVSPYGGKAKKSFTM